MAGQGATVAIMDVGALGRLRFQPDNGSAVALTRGFFSQGKGQGLLASNTSGPDDCRAPSQ